MGRMILALALVVAPLACSRGDAGTQVPATATTTVVSLQEIDCGSCGAKMVEDLQTRPGVYAASFDLTRAELSVQHEPGAVDGPAIVALAESKGFSAAEGPGQGRYLPPPQFGDELDVVEIAKAGEAVDLQAHLAPGKVTVFDYYAVWCKPCREIDAHMKQVLAAQPDVALRKLDVVDWDSDLAKAHLSGVEGLPYLVVYGSDGRRVARISGLRLDELDAAIAKARQ
jgi:thiol-disulfide isomerase/thioredoxin